MSEQHICAGCIYRYAPGLCSFDYSIGRSQLRTVRWMMEQEEHGFAVKNGLIACRRFLRKEDYDNVDEC